MATRYGLLSIDQNGDYKLGQIDYKNLLKAIQNDPAHLKEYLSLYQTVKDFNLADTNESNILDRLVKECQEFNYSLSSSLSIGAFNAIMSAKTPYSAAQAVFTPRPRVDPIAIDMDGDGVETLSQAEGAYFDLDKNGFAEKTGWIKGDDALLVRDLNGDGIINDGGELFGDQTVLSTGVKAANGFEALGELDSNQDGKISAEDAEFNTLHIWQDKNGNGITDEGELMTLSEAGIKSISLNSQTVNSDDGFGNTLARTSSVEFEDGRVNEMSEFLFNSNAIDTVVAGQQSVADDIKILPFLRGFGNSADLHTAMANDAVLKTMVEEFVNIGSTNDANNDQQPGANSQLLSAFESILFRWFGADNIAPTSRGSNMDARRLAVLEKLFAEGFTGFGATGTGTRTANPNNLPAAA